MSVEDNLKSIRKEMGLSQKEFAETLNMNARTYASYERGERDINTSVILNICKTLGISSDRLLGNTVTCNEPSLSDSNEYHGFNVLNKDNIYMIPIFGSVSAGFGSYADNQILGYEPVYIEKPHEAEETIAITVKGDSMYPKIEEGDLVIVRKQDYFENGDIVVAVICGENDGFVKRAFQSKNKLTLESINTQYPPFVFSGSELDEVKILGVVKKIIKSV
jgi:repressor LexA